MIKLCMALAYCVTRGVLVLLVDTLMGPYGSKCSHIDGASQVSWLFGILLVPDGVIEILLLLSFYKPPRAKEPGHIVTV